MRLIDEAELKEWVENWFYQNKYYHPNSKSNNIPCDELYDILDKMPTIDAVEVVRCKDCKFKQKCPTKIFGEHSDDWFCADGERRAPCSSQVS